MTEIKYITLWEIWWTRKLNGWRDPTGALPTSREIIYPKGYPTKKEKRGDDDPKS